MKIAVASGKGGTGKTFVSTNLFALMKKRGLEVVLADCDAEVPNSGIFLDREPGELYKVKSFRPSINTDKCTMCGRCADYCEYNAITCVPEMDYIAVLPELCHGCTACTYACSEDAIEEGWANIGQVSALRENGVADVFEARVRVRQMSPVPVLRKAVELAEAAEAEHIIMDAPPGCACPFVNTVIFADLTLLVTEPTPFGLSDLKHTIAVLRQLERKFAVIINRADLGAEEMKQYLEEEGIELMAEIPYSEKIAERYSRGELIIEYDEQIKEKFEQLLERIIKYEDSNNQR